MNRIIVLECNCMFHKVQNMKKGFTLIELLIVIAIIGILSAVVTISLTNSTSDARENKAKFNVAQAARALIVDGSVTSTCADLGATAISVSGRSSSITTSGNEGRLLCLIDGKNFLVAEVFDYDASGNKLYWANSGNPNPAAASSCNAGGSAKDRVCP